jgi:hypothetical protein
MHPDAGERCSSIDTKEQPGLSYSRFRPQNEGSSKRDGFSAILDGVKRRLASLSATAHRPFQAGLPAWLYFLSPMSI